jgi:hypothetical protein
MQAGATADFLMGFTEAGTGHEFQASYLLVVEEDVEVTDPQKITFKKTLSFVGARDIRQDKLDLK